MRSISIRMLHRRCRTLGCSHGSGGVQPDDHQSGKRWLALRDEAETGPNVNALPRCYAMRSWQKWRKVMWSEWRRRSNIGPPLAMGRLRQRTIMC